jgi:N-acetylmuramoyl-L-alanine amidase
MPLSILSSTAQHQPFTIMIEPSGDAKHAGRAIDDCFERGITLQCSQHLKKVLEQMIPGIRVILSRFPGESLEPLQNANFANRLAVNLYISLHFFEEKEEKPTLYLYYFLYNPTTDYWKNKAENLSFITYDQAHKNFLNSTKMYANSLYSMLQSSCYKNQFELKGIFGIPFKPLIGISAPAIAFEGSLKSKDDWKIYCEPIIQGLKKIIQQETQ